MRKVNNMSTMGGAYHLADRQSETDKKNIDNLKSENEEKINATIDILKFIMAILVIAIHTEPFGFSIWLDRGFGILTRLCVPFFFITSAYFYWLKDKDAWSFLKRILLLYVVWSIIYLPFDINSFSHMSIREILYLFLWNGNNHALWYLCASAIGFIVTYSLLKVFKPKTVLFIAIVFLLIGCFKSTWAPLFEHIFSINISDWLGSRNGLFYAFPYMALGMCIARSKDKGKNRNIKKMIVGFIISLILLVIESFIFVVIFKSSTTIMWFSVFPYAYFMFMIANNIDILLKKSISLMFRKLSTIMYVSHFLFIELFSFLGLDTMILFILVSISVTLFSIIIIKLSDKKYFKWLKLLY